MTTTATKHDKLVEKLLSGGTEKRYHGKQVVVIGDEVCILPDDDQASARMVEELEHKHPGETPHLLHVPRPETYVV